MHYYDAMGYGIKKTPAPSRPWKVQYVDYKGDGRSIRDVPETEWNRLGFARSMTIEEANARKDQLNAQAHVERHEVRRADIRSRLAKTHAVQVAYLGTDDVARFEAEILYARDSAAESAKRNRTMSHWGKATEIMLELKVDPIDWYDRRTTFYDYFSRNQLSPSYLQKVLRVLNQWGSWHCRKYRRFFSAIPSPTGQERQRIADAFYDAPGESKESDPLTPDKLESVRAAMDVELYNWLYLSIWCGLRPIEIDSLHDSAKWRLSTHAGVDVLSVYQSKLVSVAREKRWKPIPLIYPQQAIIVDIIKSGRFRRPCRRPMDEHFDGKIGVYGGRKGFTDLMLSKGQKLEDISVWMGHTTIERTWKSYKDKQSVRFTPI
jgi:hypothetical protein